MATSLAVVGDSPTESTASCVRAADALLEAATDAVRRVSIRTAISSRAWR